MSTPRPDATGTTLPPPSAFGHAIFRRVWIASLFSNFGALVQAVGAAWLMTTLSSSPQQVALVQASTTLPIMLLSLWAGAVADNHDRRLVMLGAQCFMLLVSITLAVCAWLGVLTPWLLLGFTFLIGCGGAFNNPAWQASVGDMVPRSALPNAVALNSMGFNIARSVGPAIGGAIVAAAGAATAFVLNAFTYLGLIAVLLRWRPERAPRLLPRERTGIAMAAGLRYVAMSPNLRLVMLRAALFALAASAIPALMPLIARDLLAGGALVFGVLSGAFGIGAVIAAFSRERLRGMLSTERLVDAGAIALTLGAAGTAASTNPWSTFPALMLAGFGWVLALSTFNVAIQVSSPRWVVARTLALYQMATFGGLALGSWLSGMVAGAAGVAVALLAAAAVQLVGVLTGFLLPLPQTRSLDLDPIDGLSEPATVVPIEPRTGPVVIAVEYRVAEHDHGEFLGAMNERRRICRRDGAQRWTLLRDLADPELWMERYHVPTWLDYLRTRQRPTQADAENAARIRDLLIDGEAPRVRRLIERQTSSQPSMQPPTPRELAAPLTDPSGTH